MTHMTSYTMNILSTYLGKLNEFHESYHYSSQMDIRLGGPVVEPGSGEILGRIIWDADTETYVFVPGAYEVYTE